MRAWEARTSKRPARLATNTGAETFVHSSVFLGMHAAEESLRRSCKAFFIRALSCPLVMSFEEVARCDDVVWSKPRCVQDAYYPFMDYLQSELFIRRLRLCQGDVDVAGTDHRLVGLPDGDRFGVAMVIRAGTTMVSADPRLLRTADLPVTAPVPLGEELRFPGDLEDLYRRSRVLRLLPEEVMG
jgi:hypothetical protein